MVSISDLDLRLDWTKRVAKGCHEADTDSGGKYVSCEDVNKNPWLAASLHCSYLVLIRFVVSNVGVPLRIMVE